MPAPTLSIQEVSDRLQINDLLTRYTLAIDQKDWGLLDSCFTKDAHLDYTSAGGIAGDYPKVRSWLEAALAPFPMTVHYITNSVVELNGDEATARTAVLNPMGFQNEDGSLHLFTVGAYYNDELLRTDEGWRIKRRVEEQAFMQGSLPEALQVPS
jgi:3-phenylpropionate/cinnamic acid dioxygenase small subunit